MGCRIFHLQRLPIVFAKFSILLFSGIARGEDLPHEMDTRKVSLPMAAQGHQLEIDFSLILPPTQKLGPYTSYAVYEKDGGTWHKIKEILINPLFLSGSRVRSVESVTFKSQDSEIAIHSTIYHCGKKTACYIQAFQGTTKRSPTGRKTIPFLAQATVDKFAN